MVLQHLLNWIAAKNIFQLHGNSFYFFCKDVICSVSYLAIYTILPLTVGADEKLIDQLSEEAKERLAMATSLFTNISDQLIRGDIRINVLNHILAKKNTFTELVKIGNCAYQLFLSLSTNRNTCDNSVNHFQQSSIQSVLHFSFQLQNDYYKLFLES